MDCRRIVFLTHEYAPFPGGEATYANGIVAGLRSLGREVMVIAPDYSEANQSLLRAEDNNPGVIRLLSHQKIDPRRTWQFVHRHFISGRSALFIAGEIRAGLILSVLSFFFPIQFLVMFHGSELAKAQNSYLFRCATALVISRAAGLCTNSQATLDLLRMVHKDPHLRPNARVIYLGLDRYWLTEPSNDAPDGWLELTELNDVTPRDAIVITVGRIEPRKGQLRGIQIVEQAQKCVDRKIVYVIVGKAIDQAYYEALRERARVSSIEVRLAGVVSRDRLRALYRVSDALLLPGETIKGKFEGFGLVFIEAASQGCPSLGSRIGGVEDAVAEGRSGFLFDEDDQEAFTRQLAVLLEDSDLRAQLRTTCVDHARQYTWQACAERTLSLVV
jgi:phosphatidylinositol alpha-1,6-mannosyltransferase